MVPAEEDLQRDLFPDQAKSSWHYGQGLTRRLTGMTTNLVPKGQEIVVDPQEVNGRHKQLDGTVYWSTFDLSHPTEVRKITLSESLEKSVILRIA